MTAGVIDLAEERFRRDIERLHRLGPRVLFEMLVELGSSRLIRVELDHLVGRYAGIDPAALAAAGGDRMPPPVAEVGRHLSHALRELSDIERWVDDEVVLDRLAVIGLDIEDACAAMASDVGG